MYLKFRSFIYIFLSLILPSFAAQAEVRIGALLPLTGGLQAYGDGTLRGIELAVSQINENGGVLGQEASLVTLDTQTSPQVALEAAKKIVSVYNVVGIVGALASSSTIPVATSVSAFEGVLQISPASTSPVITNLDDNDFLFRTVPSDAFQGVALAQAVTERSIDEVALFFLNDDYGAGLAESFKNAFEKNGGRVLESIHFEKNQLSYRTELMRLAATGAKHLVLIAFLETGSVITRQALEEGYFDKFIFTDGMKSERLVEIFGDKHLKDSFGTASTAPEGSKYAEAFKDAYAAKFPGFPLKQYTDSSYDAAFTIFLAIEKAQSTDRVKVRDALRKISSGKGEPVGPGEWKKAVQLIKQGKEIDYVGASGDVNFDANGDVSGFYSEWIIKDSKIVDKRVFAPK